MPIRYDLDLELEISSVWFRQPPTVEVSLDDHCLFHGLINADEKITYTGSLDQGCHYLKIQYQGKTDLDTDQDRGLDTAVILKKISFFGIDDMKFIWAGEYCPDYPVEWASQQSHPLPKLLTNQTYLGWNGTWTLRIDLPIFTWIHRIQDLGWIYR